MERAWASEAVKGQATARVGVRVDHQWATRQACNGLHMLPLEFIIEKTNLGWVNLAQIWSFFSYIATHYRVNGANPMFIFIEQNWILPLHVVELFLKKTAAAGRANPVIKYVIAN